MARSRACLNLPSFLIGLPEFMRLALFLCLLVCLVSCSDSRNDIGIPSFVVADQVDLTTTFAQGSNSHGISELWYYIDGDITGVLDLPSHLPVLKEGMHNVTVFAGIKNNGMGTSRIRYPFYTAYDTSIYFTKGELYHIQPRFEYLNNTQVDATRNFEAGNPFLEATGNDGTVELLNVPDLAASGVRCVKMELPDDATLLSFVDETNVSLTSGDVAFLELDYSCNNTFVLGLYVVTGGTSQKQSVLYLTPTNDGDGSVPTWNKVYMDLGMVASQYPSADYYRLFVECTRDEATVPAIYLDDIKVVK
jgi:hypothetical protein